jgi:hypothetical protein
VESTTFQKKKRLEFRGISLNPIHKEKKSEENFWTKNFDLFEMKIKNNNNKIEGDLVL